MANHRRVVGLRREGAAQVVGISVDYYTRLEQRRAQHVSDSILDSIARGFRLDVDESVYLHNLAAPRRRGVARTARGRVRPGLQRLLETLSQPAVVHGRFSDILAWNRLGGVLHLNADREAVSAVQVQLNAARLLFLDPRMREIYPEFDEVAEDVVAGVRADAGRHPDEPDLALITYTADAGSPSQERLDLLASWVAAAPDLAEGRAPQ